MKYLIRILKIISTYYQHVLYINIYHEQMYNKNFITIITPNYGYNYYH